jgi:RNA polymerase sigma-70 factor (ECF subfamily)
MAVTDITRLLQSGSKWDRHAEEEVVAAVYAQLRAIAGQRMRRERMDHTLDATALVHEVYVRLVGANDVQWQGRAHFFRAAAEAMRRILIDHARKRNAAKRCGRSLSLQNVADLASDEKIGEALSLDEAVLRLSMEDARSAEVVRLRFFAGLSIEETADVLGVDPRTVKRDWEFARAWLASALGEDAEAPRP